MSTFVTAKIAIKNTNDNSYSNPETLRILDISDPTVMCENFPKISFGNPNDYVFRDSNFKNCVFFYLDWVYAQKDAFQSILKIFDYQIHLRGVDRFLNSQFDNE